MKILCFILKKVTASKLQAQYKGIENKPQIHQSLTWFLNAVRTRFV